MMRSRAGVPVALTVLLFTVLLTPACLVRRRVISQQGGTPGKPRQLLSATRDDLLRRLRFQYEAIKSFNASVDMTPAVGSVYKGEITEYKDIRAYILFRKPVDIRVIGLYPVVRSKAFDMVSNGSQFRILIPSKNRFIEGRNNAPPESKNSLENLRPEAFTQALLIPPPTESEFPLLIDNTDEEASLYIMILVGKTQKGDPSIDRAIFYDRTTLQVVRQKSYDLEGNILSDTRYQDWKVYNGVAYPSKIDLNRPKDGYGVVMSVVSMQMNPALTDDKFVLSQPEGTQLQTIGTAEPPKGPTR